MKFSIGQKVVFLHEIGGGVVRKITQNGHYIIEDADGFDREFLPSELASVYSEEYNIDTSKISGLNSGSFCRMLSTLRNSLFLLALAVRYDKMCASSSGERTLPPALY